MNSELTSIRLLIKLTTRHYAFFWKISYIVAQNALQIIPDNVQLFNFHALICYKKRVNFA